MRLTRRSLIITYKFINMSFTSTMCPKYISAMWIKQWSVHSKVAFSLRIHSATIVSQSTSATSQYRAKAKQAHLKVKRGGDQC